MNPVVVFALLATFFYALQNAFIEKVLEGYNLLYVQAVFNACMLAISLLASSFVKLEGKAPTSLKEVGVVLGISLVIFVADYCFLTSYDKGGSAMVISSVIATLPVMAALIGFILMKKIPTVQETVGVSCIVAGILIFSKGG